MTDAVARILAEHGPLHTDQIVQLLIDGGEPVPDRVVDEMIHPAAELVDGRWVWLPTLLTGRIFTHRLDVDELAHDILTVSPDLDPITDLVHHAQYARLADGSPAELAIEGFDDELLEQRGIPPELVGEAGVLLLAPGTLAALGVAQGDLIGMRLTAQGLALEPVATSAPTDVGARLAALLTADEPVAIDPAVWTLCVDDPAVFTAALPPLSEIIDDAGLTRSDEYFAPAGFDFGRWDFARACTRLAQRHDIDVDSAISLQTLITLFDQMQLILDTDTEPGIEHIALLSDIGAALADPVIADALVRETVDTGRGSAEALGLLVETLEPKVPRVARAAARWLRSVACDRSGDIAAAERELLTAESLDPDWPLTLLDLAHIASDRGDAERGLALLRRAGVEADHPSIELLQRYRVAPRRDVGRNEPCWCGSGRKYKKCHLGNEQLPLDERAGWLYTKACQHVAETGWADALLEVALERSRYADDVDEGMASAVSDPLVMDAVLFEGEAFADFLRVRGPLLPEDERTLAGQWLLVQRSVFEVEQVRRGQGLTVRDVRTGDRHDVRERTASGGLKPGQLLCARVLPAGDTLQFFGGIEPVSLRERDALIELLDAGPDEVTLVAQLSVRFAPPTLTNTEGDPLMLCEATVRFADPAALDDVYERAVHERADDEPAQWIEHLPGHPQIRATLVLDGDGLRVETNSEDRMDRVLAVLAGLDPAMTVLQESRRPMSEAATSPHRDAVDPDDPELIAAMDAYIRDYETRWLDESIPALHGVTPRQAVDDPTRRDDLIKLLDSFPTTERGMSADRLRAALGLG